MPKRSHKLKLILDHLFQVLPGSSYEDLTYRINVRGCPVNVSTIAYVISILRRQSAKWGWTIPHVKRGKPMPGEEHRYFVVLLEKDGQYTIDKEDKENLARGLISTIKLLVTQSTNNAAATEMAAVNSTQKPYANMLREWSEDWKYIARQGRKLQRLVIQADGTNGNRRN
jgi:hypothetical protein